MEAAQLATTSAMTENWSSNFEAYPIDYDGLDSMNICHLELPFAYIFIPILYFLSFLIGFFGNLFVILLMARKQGSKRLVDTFVLNLAIADLIFVFTLPFWALSAALDGWLFSEGLCKLSSYTISVNRCSSILLLTGMSMERFLVMTKRWDAKSIGTRKNAITSCGCIWAISLLLGIPSLVYRNLTFKGDSKYSCQGDPPATFSVVMLSLTFLLPLGVILFCYCSIFSKLRSHARLGKRRNNALKIIFTIIGAFVCSWLPFNTFKMIFTMTQNIELSCQALRTLFGGLTITACLAFVNSCINPVIYVFMDQHFRRQVLMYFPGFCKAKGNMQASSMSFSSTESSVLFGSRKKLPPATSVQI
uniref:Probable G-protein coupled receptor 25 n=1 Tax=Anolis carolinensis TaxID=28377 RepID=G1KJP2_ANOCA|nr:PREDICTED: probable G-protein coupled receptor 25 [Anolis carolinensis]|eukprot:XP_003220471.1 PREDICTED: probable G-protein coupled receptor 25 [Anolis carolinensis]